jgi:hypothetical protein
MSRKKDLLPKKNSFQFVIAAHNLAPRYRGVHTIKKTGTRGSNKGKAYTDTVKGSTVQLVLRELASSSDGQTGLVWASYERIKFFTGLTGCNSIANAFQVLMEDKVIVRKRRYSGTTKTFLNLVQMKKLRVPYVSANKKDIIERINKYMKEPMSAEHFTVVNDDRYVFTVVDWFLDLNEAGKAAMAFEGHDLGFELPDDWDGIMGFNSFCEFFGESYAPLRSNYFKSVSQEEPPLKAVSCADLWQQDGNDSSRFANSIGPTGHLDGNGFQVEELE